MSNYNSIEGAIKQSIGTHKEGTETFFDKLFKKNENEKSVKETRANNVGLDLILCEERMKELLEGLTLKEIEDSFLESGYSKVKMINGSLYGRKE